jgi:molecular chaperone DnaJ
MKNPYEVLGIREGASIDEIKSAYRELVKKYHPDRYTDNPLKDLAEEKMVEINEAYDYLTKNNNTSTNNGYSSSNYRGYDEGSSDNYNFQKIRDFINRNDFKSAEAELNNIGTKNAEWYFLSGIISMRKGWYNQGYQDLNRAVNMDPSNYEYRDTLNRVMGSNKTYNNYSYASRGDATDDICTMCTCLLCSDQCCECMGRGC